MMRHALLSLLLSLPLLAESPVYQVTTLAGTPGLAGAHDDVKDRATFNRPTWIDVVKDDGDYQARKGDIYIVDRANRLIRRIFDGKVSTYRVIYGYFDRSLIPFDFGGPLGGGILIEPQFGGCGGGEYDRGFWLANTGLRQVRLVAFNGQLANRDGIFTIGSGLPGSTDGFVLNAQFETPTGLAESAPSDYVGYQNISKRTLYVADTGNHTIRTVHFQLSFEGCPQPSSVLTLAGVAGLAGSTDGPGGAARFNAPRGLALGLDGSIYVADSGNHTIRRIDANGVVTTVAGEPGVPGSNDGLARQAHLNTPSGIDVDYEGNVFITDTGNHTIRELTTDGALITIAGFPGVAGYADGIAIDARFFGPVGIRALPNGTLIVADTSSHVLRLLTPIGNRRRTTPR